MANVLLHEIPSCDIVVRQLPLIPWNSTCMPCTNVMLVISAHPPDSIYHVLELQVCYCVGGCNVFSASPTRT